VIIKHIYTELMITNPLNKGVPPFKFKNHIMKMRLSSSCDFSCMKYIIFKKIIFIMMFSHIYTHLYLFEKTRMYRKKNKHKVYLLSEIAT